MKQLVLEVVRINEDVISTSGMCEYIDQHQAHWRFHDKYYNNDAGEWMFYIDSWTYTDGSGWTKNPTSSLPVSVIELLYSVTPENDDFYRVFGADGFEKCTGDHSYLLNIEEN